MAKALCSQALSRVAMFADADIAQPPTDISVTQRHRNAPYSPTIPRLRDRIPRNSIRSGPANSGGSARGDGGRGGGGDALADGTHRWKRNWRPWRLPLWRRRGGRT